MNCKCVSQKIGSYLDGELAGSEMIAIRAHLNRCDACAEESESLRSLKSAIANLPCCEAPEGLEDRLMAAVRRESFPMAVRGRRGIFWGAAVGTATCAGFAFGWLFLMDRQPEASAIAASASSPAMDVARDQVYVTGADPLSGQTMVVPASYATRD